MNIRGEKCLAVNAKQQISICCQTLCDKEVVEEYIKELEDLVVELQNKINELEENNGE